MVRSLLQGQKGFTLIELMMVVAVLGIVSAIAIPNYLLYQAKTRQAEAKTNLGGIFVAQTSYFGDQSVYGSFSQIGFKVASASNRYTYRSGGAAPGGGGSSNTPNVDQIPAPVGGALADGQGPAGITAQNATPGNSPGFTATAVANLDSDLTFDQWHVNDIKQDLRVADNDDVSG